MWYSPHQTAKPLSRFWLMEAALGTLESRDVVTNSPSPHPSLKTAFQQFCKLSCQVHSLCSSHLRRSVWNKDAYSKSCEILSTLRTHPSLFPAYSACPRNLNTVSLLHTVNGALCTLWMMWSSNLPQSSSCMEPELDFTALSSLRAGHVLCVLPSDISILV